MVSKAIASDKTPEITYIQTPGKDLYSKLLFPDLGGYDKWSDKAKKLLHISHFNVSDLLERKATNEEKQQGLDLAYYLLKFSLSKLNSAEKTDLEKLIKKNPALNKLIEKFDLEVINISNNAIE